MANETATAPREAQREAISIFITPVDEKLFESEIRHINNAASEEKRSRENFETRIEKAVNDLRGDIKDLRGDMNSRFEKVDARFEKVDAQFEKVDARFEKIDEKFEKIVEKIDGNFKWMLTTYIAVMGVVLAAFYAFASYIKK